MKFIIIKSLSIDIRILLLESTTMLVILATLSMKEEWGEKRKKQKASKQRPLRPGKLIWRVTCLKPSLRILLLY